MATITTEVDLEERQMSHIKLRDEIIRHNLSIELGDSSVTRELIETMYHKYRCKQPIDDELRTFFYNSIGRIA